MTFKRIFIIILIYFSFFGLIYSQQFYKITCSFTIKEKLGDDKFFLSKGTASYDKYLNETVLEFSFPSKENWILTSDSLYKIIDNKVVFRQEASFLIDYSIFRLFLNGTLKNYGFKNSLYQIKNIEVSENMILITWEPPKEMIYQFGKVITSQKDNKLIGVAFYNLENELISKQVFSKYKNLNSLFFPTKIIQITYLDNKENYKITTFDNIMLDDE